MGELLEPVLQLGNVENMGQIKSKHRKLKTTCSHTCEESAENVNHGETPVLWQTYNLKPDFFLKLEILL